MVADIAAAEITAIYTLLFADLIMRIFAYGC